MTGLGIPYEVSGNFLNYELLRFDWSKWNRGSMLYWDEGSFDVFAYYPYIPSPSGVDDLPFSVALDQSATSTDSGLDGYEASDFLWATDTEAALSDFSGQCFYRAYRTPDDPADGKTEEER